MEDEQKGKPEEQNPFRKLSKKLQENRGSLYISRVPDKTRGKFIALANEEFCGDYGMCFKDILEKAEDYDKVKPNLLKLIGRIKVTNSEN